MVEGVEWEAELASTLIVKRRANNGMQCLYLRKPKEGMLQSVVSFDINENTVAIGRIDLPSTVDKVVDWNRQYTTQNCIP